MNYYNENNKKAAAWLRELVRRGLIAEGEVDERSIADVRAGDLRGYRQCHWFAGIGIWSLALRWAGVPDEAEVWTGSCPCQPFSGCGKKRGEKDDRHLWPEWYRLIRDCRPPVLFGEQVAGKLGWPWLASVRDALEREGYAVGAAGLPACSVGAPHLRQRIYFGAASAGPEQGSIPGPASHSEAIRHAHGGGRNGKQTPAEQGRGRHAEHPGGAVRGASGIDKRRDRVREKCAEGEIGGSGGGLRHPDGARREGHARYERQRRREDQGRPAAAPGGAVRGAACQRRERERERVLPGLARKQMPETPWAGRTFWDECEFIPFRNPRYEKPGQSEYVWRPIKPGVAPLASGYPGRVDILRAIGNAIVAPLATTFVISFLEALDDLRDMS